MTYKATSRLGVLLGVALAGGLTVLGLPGRLISSVTYAVETGRIQASSDRLASPQDFADRFKLVARVARAGVVQITVAAADDDREEFERLQTRMLDLEREIRGLGAKADSDELNAKRKEYFDLNTRLRGLAERLSSGTGSGIIFDQSGSIVTNNHVVEGRKSIKVRLFDDRVYDARLVGTDPKTDLAMIRISADDLHPLKFGDSDKAEVGDWVLALGSPFGLPQTVTHGIISAKGRGNVSLGRDIMYREFMQTDAAINPGNSGGPLVNLKGEVVGVNTAIATREEGAYNAGVAFVIPSNLAKKIADKLKSSGEVARGWLGVSLAELKADDSKLLDLDRPVVMVDELYAGAPAEKAGFQCEDVILSVDGHAVRAIRELQGVIADRLPGEKAKFEILRDGEKRTIEVSLDKQPQDINAFARSTRSIRGRELEHVPGYLRSLRPGWIYGEPDDESGRAAVLRRLFAGKDGVLIVSPRDVGVAYDVEAGDLIVAAGGTPVKTVTELQALIEKSKSSINLTVERSGAKKTIEIRR